jgi:hypothetical protein
MHRNTDLLYRHGGTKLLKYRHGIVMDAWERELLPAEWKKMNYIPHLQEGRSSQM